MIILFNGPPGSGKDTLANALIDRLHSSHIDACLEKFARPLKDCVPAFYGISVEEFKHMDSSVELKAQPQDCFLGKTCREVQIAFSEDYAKPLHGKNFFGLLLAERIKKLGEQVVCVSDSGFSEEAETIIEEFGKENVMLVNIIRDGTTFEGDSRGYINVGCSFKLVLHNNKTVCEAVDTLWDILAAVLPIN